MPYHEGKIWSNVTEPVHRRSGPTTHHPIIDQFQAGQEFLVLCYSLGDTEQFENPTNPPGHPFTSNAWDFVVTSEQDTGGYVADVFIDTGGDIRQQLGTQGTCPALKGRLV